MHADSVRLAVLAVLYGASLPAAAGEATAPATIAAASRVIVLDRAAIEATGLTSLAKVLEQLPVAGGTLGTRYNGGGSGSAFVDLRNLGPQRTLVLVDGRRWVSELGGTVDLHTIPLAAVERIEITPHGSALHGADAVAGVVDVILRKDYAGAEARAQLGEYDEGDGRSEAYEVTLGSATARAGVMLNASYTKDEPVFQGDREETAVPVFGFPGNDVNAGASSTTPFGRFGFGPNGGRLPNGAPGTLTLVPGRPGTSASDFRPFDLRTGGYNFAPESYLDTPQERTALYASARYALTDDVAFRASMLYNERRSEQQFAPQPLVFGVVGSGPLRFTIPASAVYNPFGAAVTRAQFRNAVAPREFRQDVDTFRFDAGFDGAFEAFDRTWRWDLGYAYSDSEEHALSYGLFDATRLQAGLGPSFRDANGNAVCGTPAAPVAGCVPLNLFGGPDGFTRAMFDYATFVAQDTQYRETHGYTANLEGTLFELPAGPLALAAGYEYRRESGFDLPDAFVQSGASTGSPRAPTAGAFDADELFLAFDVPLLADVALADSLALTVAARHADYSTSGDTTNPHFGFRWKPFAELALHGGYDESFRAPSIAELFRAETDTFPILLDPCAASLRPAPDVLARCRSGFGGVPPVPPGYEQHNGQYIARIGGNPDLRPELGRSRTLGLAWTPAWAPRLQVYLDWTALEVRDLVGRRTMTGVLEDCYVRARVESCAYVVRDASGDPSGTFAGNMNLDAGRETEAWDLGMRYGIDTTAGAFDFTAVATYVSWLGELGQPDRGDVLEAGGFSETRAFGNEVGVSLGRGLVHQRIKANLGAAWSRGDFGASLGFRYRSGVDERCDLPRFFGRPQLCSNPQGSPQFPNGENRLDDVWYTDVQLTWDAPWDARFTAGIRNALDEDAPIAYGATDGNLLPEYDLPGRWWYLRYAQRF